jgi:hypothetical protein
MEAALTNKRQFSQPPRELLEQWVEEADQKLTTLEACQHVAQKASEWGFATALCPDPNSLKQRALRGLERIKNLGVVSTWVGKDVFQVIEEALESLPDNT